MRFIHINEYEYMNNYAQYIILHFDYKMMDESWHVSKERWNFYVSVVFVHFFLWFYDLKIIFQHQPTFIYSCIFEVHHNTYYNAS